MRMGDGRKLTGQRNQCPTCGEYFSSNRAFTKHRIGEFADRSRRCRTPDEMRAAGMGINAGGWWMARVMPAELRAKFVNAKKANGDKDAIR